MGNRIVMAEMILKPRFWQGNKLKFDSLVSSMQLERGKIYFVGDSISQRVNGLDNSAFGIINIATSSTTFVQFGTFDLKDLEKRITEIEQRLEDLGGNVDELIKEVVILDEEVVTLGGKVSEIGSKVSTIEKGAEKNKINVVERNGQAITPSEDKVINILVPINTSELNNDSKYQTDADVAETIIGVNLNTESGIITLTRKNGTTFTIDLPTEKIIKSGYYDSDTEEIVLVLEDESEIRFGASELVNEYYADGTTLELYTDTEDNNKHKFRLTTSYKNKIDGSEQSINKTSSVTSSSTATQYPSALAVWNAIKNFATSVQTFTQASTRTNIESGETISTSFGKIKKWFADLKTVAFSGSYNDLIDKPTIATLAKSEQDSTEESFTDTQKIIASRASGEWEKAYSKTAMMMWNYINSKISSVLGLTASKYGGTSEMAVSDEIGNNIVNSYCKRYSVKNNEIGVGWAIIGYVNSNKDNTSSYKDAILKIASYTLINSKYPSIFGNINISVKYNGEGYVSINKNLKSYISVKWDNELKRAVIWGYFPKLYHTFIIVKVNNNEFEPASVTEFLTSPEGDNILELSEVLEINNSNINTYFNSSTEILTIAGGISVIVFNTTNVITISSIQQTNVFNGKRITLVGNFSPSQQYSTGNIEGRFSSYLYFYRGGSLAYQTSLPGRIKDAFEDFIYFNGVWYSKGY